MKNFADFLLEAEIKWNTGTLPGSRKSPSDTAKQKKANIEREARTKPSPKVFSRLTKIKKGISGADTLAKDTDPKPETTATRMQRTGRTRKNTGYATFRDTPTSSVGTVSGVRRRGLEPSDTRVSGRFGTVSGGRGTGISRSGGKIGG
jgi:hypothetical protein